MSDTTPPRSFRPKDEQPVPFWPLPDPPPSKEERVYVIGMEAAKGRLRYYFVESPPVPDPAGDAPLQIRVPQDCTIVFRLSPDWNWEFRHDDAVVLGPISYPEKPRYFNLVPTIMNGRCMEVRFNALYLDGTDGNADLYAVYINVDHDVSGAADPAPLLVRIDPDILNPGERA